MSADIAQLRERLDAIDKDINERVVKLRAVLDEATDLFSTTRRRGATRAAVRPPPPTPFRTPATRSSPA
jgi:hypothetical protein